MGRNSVTWLTKFADDAKSTDQFTKDPHHVQLLALGLLGEAGSVLAEVKKGRREGSAYPGLQMRVQEELGDFLWYYVRLVSVLERGLLDKLDLRDSSRRESDSNDQLDRVLKFGAAAGAVVVAILHSRTRGETSAREVLQEAWSDLKEVSEASRISLREAARTNVAKRVNRWPTKPESLPVFDDEYPYEEQLPRKLKVDFLERKRKDSPVVILRINGLNIGDRITDNIEEPDEYRYHDVFHFAHAAMLGWSPVTRSLLRCKRKSKRLVDENEDGGRAQVIEEAISAMVFSRAKELRYFEDMDHLDYDLLKIIQQLVQGYEVDRIPLWQWEKTILKAYEVFRKIRAGHGGRILIDFRRRMIQYQTIRA